MDVHAKISKLVEVGIVSSWWTNGESVHESSSGLCLLPVLVGKEIITFGILFL